MKGVYYIAKREYERLTKAEVIDDEVSSIFLTPARLRLVTEELRDTDNGELSSSKDLVTVFVFS